MQPSNGSGGTNDARFEYTLHPAICCKFFTWESVLAELSMIASLLRFRLVQRRIAWILLSQPSCLSAALVHTGVCFEAAGCPSLQESSILLTGCGTCQGMRTGGMWRACPGLCTPCEPSAMTEHDGLVVVYSETRSRSSIWQSWAQLSAC